MIKLPSLIGICGHPKSGKSLTQTILRDKYEIQPVDDGAVLREIAMKYFGADISDVYTQEGKAGLAYWPNGDPILDAERGNSHMTWRQVLGRIGAKLEELFGEYIMPMITCAQLPMVNGKYDGIFSFGSVRKKQGGFYREHGGVVLGINNPSAEPSGNDFDRFDESLIDYWILNDGLARGLSEIEARKALENEIDRVMEKISFNAAA